MKLSELTRDDKIRLAAEIDGWTGLFVHWGTWYGFRLDLGRHYSERIPDYDKDYNEIIPLIQKLGMEVVLYETIWDKKTTPAQLLDTLLVAAGKAEL